MPKVFYPVDPGQQSMDLAEASLEVATASLDAALSHIRAAGRPDLTDPVRDTLSQARALRLLARLERSDDEELVGRPPSDWFYAN